MGNWLGSRLGQRMLGDKAPTLGFDAAAFPARIFYRRRAWFIPLLVCSMRVRDRLDALKRSPAGQ